MQKKTTGDILRQSRLDRLLHSLESGFDHGGGPRGLHGGAHVFQTAASVEHQDLVLQTDQTLLDSFVQASIGSRTSRFSKDAYIAQRGDRRQDFGVADGEVGAACLPGGSHGAYAIAWQVNRDAIRQGVRRYWDDRLCPGAECVRDRRRTLGLNAIQARRLLKPAHSLQILKSLVQTRDDVPVADRDEDRQGPVENLSAEQTFPDFKGGRFFAFQRKRIIPSIATVPAE